jgi:hypothetical protein
MILVPKRMRLLGKGHDPRPKLVQPTVHRLVDAVEPRRFVPCRIMIIKCINHLPDLVELVEEEERLCLVRVADGLEDLSKA